MPKLKISHVVSFSSEDPNFPANNLLEPDPAKKWKCKNPGEKQAFVILQLEKASMISGIDIGNENSTYVEVLVARSDGSRDSDFKVLLMMSSFMTPLESRQSSNMNKVRMFTTEQLSSPERDEKWDRIKVVCTQPFNRHVQYGLSFITLHSPEDKNLHTPVQQTIGKFVLRPPSPNDIGVGSTFLKKKEAMESKTPSGFFYTTIPNCFRSVVRHSSQTVLAAVNSVGTTEKIEIKGWVKSLRKLKEHLFFDISDGLSAHKLQITIPVIKQPEKLNVGASVVVKGYLGQTPNGQLELNAEEVEICGSCPLSEGYPFLPRKQYSAEYIRQYLHLRPKTNKFSSLLRIRSQASAAIHEHFASEGYINIHTPIITSNDCEGAGEIFKVLPENKSILKNMRKTDKNDDEAYFDCKTYLTVSAQLHLEATCHALSKVYTFGPTFRAENSKSRLHLSEFYMVEAEIAFINRIEELAANIEKLLKKSTENIINKCDGDIQIARDGNTSYDWISKKFPVLTYDEARETLDRNFKIKIPVDDDFTKEQELLLVKFCGDVPTFIINWPTQSKPFYMRGCDDNKNRVFALDLLVPNVGELVGGSLRENNYEKLKEKLPNQNDLSWYLDLRKFGGVSTGGYGLGFERYLQFLLGIDNIKDTIPFPRWPHHCDL